MPDLLYAAIGFSLSQVILAAVLLVPERRRSLRETLFGLLLLSILGYLLTPLGQGWWLGSLGSTVQTLTPGVFWLFSASLFQDQFRLRPWHLLLVAATVVPPTLGQLLGLNSGAWRWLLFGLPQTLEFVLLGLTLWVVSRHWRTDLVEARRRLRFWFIGINGSFIFLLILSREILFRGEDWLDTWQYVATGVVLLGINLALLQYRPGMLFPEPAAEAVAEESPPAVEPELLDRLRAFMDAEQAWREMGLTIGDLAARLELPQYRLRQAINVGLGYRNFSDFLNRYRIQEAAARLSDPAEKQLPVLTIAMDAGFRSLSSFNKAFKEAQGVTPTAWRKQSLPAAD